MRTPLRTFVDWYIAKYHAEDYIHTSQIQSEISRRIESAVARNNADRDRELDEALKTERMKHKIIEDGYCAEIVSMEKLVKDAKDLRADVESMYFKVVERAKQIMLISAETKHERTEIINDLSATMGKLDNLSKLAEDINKEIDNKKPEDEKLLRIK